MATWTTTKTPGVRYRLHNTRKHGVSFDKYFAIRMYVDAKRIEQGLGWATEGWSEKKAAAVLAELKANKTPVIIAEPSFIVVLPFIKNL